MPRGDALEAELMDKLLQGRIEEDPQLREAAEWFLEMRSDNISGERIAEWQQWLLDMSHREAFGRVEALWHLVDGATVRWPTEAEVAADEYSGAESITAWQLRGEQRLSAPARARRVSHWNWRDLKTALVGVAAAAALAVVCLLYWPLLVVALQGGSRITVATGVGKTRTMTLPDGSVIYAGADTSVIVNLLKQSRTAVLAHGEAYFRVAKDPSRPFAVHAGDTTVTDVGTAFDVRRSVNGVIVAVAEGVVDVATRRLPDHAGPVERFLGASRKPGLAAIQLTAGHRLALESINTLPQLSSVNPNWVGGWREGRLQYLDEPLNGVVEDLARYSSRRIVIATPALANLRVTGVVFVKNIDGWLASLEATFPVRVVSEADGTALIEER
jgi:transmembrane sensor